MRTVNFRDDVLWAIARKRGFDPFRYPSFIKDQADAIASSINSWVRKLWDSQDWPELTMITPRTPAVFTGGEADDNHFVSYEPDPAGPDKDTPPLGRILKVYLNNPEIIPGSLDTDFRLLENGVHVGYEHGSTVWIKHVSRAPEFTAEEWSPGNTYRKGDLAYAPVPGECYKSLLDGNINRDPTPLTNPAPEIVQAFVQGNPAIIASHEVWQIKVTDPAWYNLLGTVYKFVVMKPDGSTGAVSYTTPAAGGTVSTLMTGIAAAFAGSPNPFITALTVTTDATSGNVRIEHATSAFSVDFTVFNADQDDPGPIHPIGMKHLKYYTAGIAAVDSVPQITNLSLSDNLEAIPATYELVFIDMAGVRHTVIYEAVPDTSIETIMDGLLEGIDDAAATDEFFTRMVALPNFTLFQLSFVTVQKVDVQLTITNNQVMAWELIPFPWVLCEQVVRGAVSDVMREGGQTDKADAEEKATGGENIGRASATTGPDWDPLTDQVRPRSRYQVEVGA